MKASAASPKINSGDADGIIRKTMDDVFRNRARKYGDRLAIEKR